MADQEEKTKENRDGETALVKKWLGRIKSAQKYYGKPFKQMETCMDIAALGAKQEWIDEDNYVVPILVRHINQCVSQLYAKNPKAVVERKKRLLNTVWDGTASAIQEAQKQMSFAQDMGSKAQQAGDGATLMLAKQQMQSAQAILADAQEVKSYNAMLDRTAKTMELLFDHFMGEQEFNYKQQLKALVRRTKTVAVGYVKLGFQRIMEPRPEITARISDVTNQIAEIEQMTREVDQPEKKDDVDEESTVEQLKHTLASLQAQESLILREGPVLDFPAHDGVLIDPRCTHVRSLAGARWIAYSYMMTSRDIEKVYEINVTDADGKDIDDRVTDNAELLDLLYDEPATHNVYEIWDKETRTCVTVCEGHRYYLKAPAAPDVFVEKFFNLFCLVFNEVEHKKIKFPPSDVWQARHTQMEYNRSRQGLREHRIASRPYYVVASSVEEEEMNKLGNHQAHEMVRVAQLVAGQKVEDFIQRGVTANIDPNLYEVEMLFTDMLRTVGAQEANLGGTSGSTATESSIAEQSRSTSQADNVDDLDDLLTEIAKAMSHLMLLELSKETVVEIVGPGAAWPEHEATREEIAKDLSLAVKAGSSGRPNRAAELANLERALPYLLQMPGLNPMPILKKYAALLDLELEDLIAEGMPSITALNALTGRQVGEGGQPTGDGATDPNAQGAAGAQNAPSTQSAQPGPQPAYPAPAA